MILGIVPCIFDKDGNIDYKAHAEAGFKSIDFQSFINDNSALFSLNNNNLACYCKNELRKAKEAGMFFNQLHSFWVWPPQEFDKDANSRNKILKYYKTAIRSAYQMECRNVAIHHRVPLSFDDKNLNDEAYKTTVDFLKLLVPYAAKYKVTLCLENLPFPQPVYNVINTIDIVKQVNSKYCKCCIDTGHANITEKDFFNSLEYAKDYIKIFHVHDNDGKGDLHWVPGKGTIDWKRYGSFLKGINYQGVVSLETCCKIVDSREENIKNLKELYKSTINLIK